MASFPKSTKQPIAVTHWSNIDLSCQHITTGNFMEFNVAKAMELCPRQSIDIDMRTFARLAPMPLPTYGNADIKNRAYFVPFRTVMKGFNEFIDDTTVVDGLGEATIPIVLQIPAIQLIKMFLSSSMSATTTGTADFVHINSDGVTTARVFTIAGKHAYKLLCSLGYRLPFDERSAASFTISALPLLCLLKIYFDWYFPSAYVDDDRANSVRRMLNLNPTADEGDFNSYFSSQNLEEIFTILYRVSYDSDYFVSAWDNPVAPNNGSYSSIILDDATTQGNESIRTLSNGTPVLRSYDYGGGTSQFNELTQFAVDALKSVSDYMRRHQISGARVLDRYLSRWGVRLPDAALDRSVFIGESISKLDFGDVTSTSDSFNDESGTGSVLGGYAGKGIGDTRQFGNGIVHYSTDEFGMLIIVSTIVPKTAYYQGMDRCTFHTKRFDFYTPEFDNLGTQALATRELFVPIRDYNQADELNGIDYDSSVFGFTPRFAEYKRGYDNMTGDLVLHSKNVGLEGWTLMRDVSNYFDPRDTHAYADVVHDQGFVEGKDANQYNRIFYVTDNEEDKFYIIHNFKINTRFPGKALYDSYEFKDYDKAEKVHIDVNGVRAN